MAWSWVECIGLMRKPQLLPAASARLPTVTVGQSVAQGDTIGSVGTTALAEAGEVYHLHFAMRADGQSVDPAEYLPKF